MRTFGITRKLWLAMLLLAALPLVALQQALEKRFGEAMRATISGHLQAVTLIKMAQIDSHIAHVQENAQTLAQAAWTTNVLKELGAEKNRAAAQKLRQLRQQYLALSDSIADPEEIYDLLLVSPSGEVVLTRKEEPDMGANLYTGPYRDTHLARLVRETQQTRNTGFSGYEYYPPSRAQAAFVAAPVIEGGRLIGVLVLQISQGNLDKLTGDYSGLGETGEVVIAQRAGDAAVIVAPLRTNQDKPPLKVRKDGIAVLFDALDQEHGVGIRRDYRGEEVLAAWGYLPRTQWGVVVKIDTAEVFSPIRQMRQWGYALLLGIIALVGLVALWMGRSIVRPIKTLTRLSGEIAGGDLDKRIPPGSSSDELGDLSGSFNRMAASLQQSQNALLAERQGLADAVQQRTADLEEANVHLLQEIADHQAAKEDLLLAQAVYQSIVQGVVVSDAENKIISVNPSYSRITGYSAEELMGRKPGFNKSGYHDEAFYRHMWQIIAQEGRWEGEVWDRRKNGEVFPAWLSINVVRDKQGNIFRHIGVISDVTEQKEAREKIYFQANYDDLTGLPNRRLLMDRLDQEVRKARRNSTQVALLFVDLDNFKEINDTFGHERGDKLLHETAQRIQACVREVDTVARLGGDEFTVVLPYIKSNREVDRVAQKVIDSLAVPFDLETDMGYVSASMGITVFPFDGESGAALLRNADQAMYDAKKLGKNRFSYYTSTMQQASQQRLHLSNELRAALLKGELEMYFQPIHDLRSGEVVKAEALIRWHRADGKHVGPDVFIGLAEEIGLIAEIGQFAFEQSVSQLKGWNEVFPHPVGVAVNLSPRQISGSRSNFSPWLELLQEQGVPATSITLEITEGTLLDDNHAVRDRLARLRDAGCSIALDDFGTGYSSLSYLKKMNVDFIKVDKSFVRDLAVDLNDFALVEAIIVMAHKLGIKVIAEGVETAEQRDILAQIGCDFVQGYYFARPMPAQDFINYLKANSK
ncbi:MAG: PAS/PAC sensor-containing diguanylate cyclase/phosphodiesterase [Gallionellaceae bacterium]|nr:MAG: PAS/PAC sensor-containing diguanylate cyclase/phosphodiesterase [Gallionellaceae bacterium]